MSVGYRQGSGSAVSGEFRWLLHDPIDPSVGYPSLSGMEVAKFGVTATESGNVTIDELTLVRAEKLAPTLAVESNIAWEGSLGARRLPSVPGLAMDIGPEVCVGYGVARWGQDVGVAANSMVGIRPGWIRRTDGWSFETVGLLSSRILIKAARNVRIQSTAEYAFSVDRPGSGGVFEEAVLNVGISQFTDVQLRGGIGQGAARISFGMVSFH